MGCKDCKNCSCGKKKQEEEKANDVENELATSPDIVVGEIRGDKVNEFMDSIPMKANKSPIATYHGTIDSEGLKKYLEG